MIDIGFSKLALIGAVALVVIGPEKLPRVARTVGTLLGKAQRYVADVKAEVNRSMELDELRKMKESVEGAAREVEHSIHSQVQTFEQDWADTTRFDALGQDNTAQSNVVPSYRHPGKNWRLKRGTMPQWYKARHGVRTKVQSGAARVARHRPPKFR